MNISWGWKIAGLYIAFATLIIVLVVKSMHQHYDLADNDYYAKEIKYQQVIDAGKNQSALSAPVSMQRYNETLTFTFPAEFTNQAITGTIHFYAAANAAWDADFAINTANLTCPVPLHKLHHTHYDIKISWEAGGKQYYQESAINLSHP